MATFFESTLGFREQTTALFDFVTPTAVAMWNLRWQVQGYLAAVPEATKEALEGRFIAGADLAKFDLRRANLRRAAVEKSWDEQLEDFARVILFASIGAYEGWIAETTQIFRATKKQSDALQFPSRGVAGRTLDGVGEALTALTANSSKVMRRTLVPPLLASTKYARNSLDDLLVCYRYFKQCRNCLLHSGGRSSRGLHEASGDMQGLTAASLGIKSLPDFQVFAVGDPVTVSLRGVIAFCDVLYRIVSTIDAELAGTVQAEQHFLQRWSQKYGKQQLKRDIDARELQISRMTQHLKLPTPSRPRELDRILRRQGLVLI